MIVIEPYRNAAGCKFDCLPSQAISILSNPDARYIDKRHRMVMQYRDKVLYFDQEGPHFQEIEVPFGEPATIAGLQFNWNKNSYKKLVEMDREPMRLGDYIYLMNVGIAISDLKLIDNHPEVCSLSAFRKGLADGLREDFKPY